MQEIIRYQEAVQRGLKTYFTGRPCRLGHLGLRRLNSRKCQICANLQRNQRRAAMSGEARAARLAYEKVFATRRRAVLRAERIALAGRPPSPTCDLCSAPAKTVWDHDHATGQFRGWLCTRCNRTLGQVHDSVDLLRQMADYVERRQPLKRQRA